jgi:hypothetical protein
VGPTGRRDLRIKEREREPELRDDRLMSEERGSLDARRLTCGPACQ